MSATCQAPVPIHALIDHLSGELGQEESDRMDEHLMGCSSCTEAGARLAAVIEELRAMVPPLVSDEMLAALRARGLCIEENAFRPGERKPVVYRDGVDLLIHRLGGLDLSRAAAVDVTVRDEETGDILLEARDVPHNRVTGEVLVACRRHFAAFPPNIVFQVRARGADGAGAVAEYIIPHAFAT
jgi:hypothetical protein